MVNTATARIIKLQVFSSVEEDFAVPASLRSLGLGEKLPPKHGVMRIPTRQGDDRIVWDSDNFEEIREAKETFDGLVLKGMTPTYSNGDTMSQFDPYAEQICFIPIGLIRGG